MIALDRVYVPDAQPSPPDPPPPPRGYLTSRIEKLLLEERDAVRRRDWPAARTAAEERAALQEARHRLEAARRSA